MILKRLPKAKAILYFLTDTEVRKRGEQIGLDTLVVHAVTGEYSIKVIALNMFKSYKLYLYIS